MNQLARVRRAQVIRALVEVNGRLASRVQLTMGGHKPYLEAVEGGVAVHVWDIQEIVSLLDPSN